MRAFLAHTAGLRQLVAWLPCCAVTTVALEASGVYGHVLFLTLREAGFTVVMTAPAFTRPIKGRPKTDRRDCPWLQRLPKHGLLPSVFQPDEATHTLRDLVRQRVNPVRLSGQHLQRLQKALERRTLKLTKVLGDVPGVSERGTAFSKWPTSKHFTSWLGLGPNGKKTGGKVPSRRTRQGKNRAAAAVRRAAWSRVRSPRYLGA